MQRTAPRGPTTVGQPAAGTASHPGKRHPAPDPMPNSRKNQQPSLTPPGARPCPATASPTSQECRMLPAPPNPSTPQNETPPTSPRGPHPARSTPTYHPSQTPTAAQPSNNAPTKPPHPARSSHPCLPQAPAGEPDRFKHHDQVHARANPAQIPSGTAHRSPAEAVPTPANATHLALPQMRRPLALRPGTALPTQRVRPAGSAPVPISRQSVPTRDQRPDRGQPQAPTQQPAPTVPQVAGPSGSRKGHPASRTNLTRVTINLTPSAREAASKLCTEGNSNLTDAINRALRVAAIVQNLAPENRLQVLQKDGTVATIYVL